MLLILDVFACAWLMSGLRIFGSSNDRYVAKLGKIVEAINAFEPAVSALSDEELANQTIVFRQRLLASVGHELRLSPRGAWQVVLRSGLSLQLGRGDVTARLARFVAAWPRLVEQQPEPHYVDLRYAGGFATRRAATVTVPTKNDRK